jgi:threonine efflux protein
MELTYWLSLFSVCLVGAMSPGPSLAVVTQSSISEGRRGGVSCALAHGLGVGLYGLLTIMGLALLITQSPLLFLLIQLLGTAYLLKLGWASLTSDGSASAKPNQGQGNGHSPATRGFLIAFLNPKLAVFMLALFSQFLRPEYGLSAKSVMVLTVGVTDALWYSLIAVLVSHPSFLKALADRALVLDRVFGVIIIALAVTVALRALQTLTG